MKKVLLIIGLVIVCLVSFSEGGAKQRTSKNVRQQQRVTEQKIKQTDAEIKENTRQLKSKLNDLNKLQAEAQTINASITQLQASIDSLAVVAKAANDSIKVLDGKLSELQRVFADILRKSRRNRSAMSNLAFIFSSESFTQALRRANALKQFTRWRQRKVDQIIGVKALLDERRRYVDSLMVQNRELAMRLSMRHAELSQRTTEANNIVTSLKGKERDLKNILKEQQRQAKELDRELDRIIKEEQRKALLEEQKRKQREEEERKKREEERKKRAEEERRAKAEKDAKAQKPDKSATPDDTKSTKKSDTKKPDTKKPDAKKPDTKKPDTKKPDTKEPTPALSSDFAANKGRLPYPVNPHTIVRRFGVQPHAVNKNVVTDNAGLDIQSSRGATVKCVFDGEVSAITLPDGYNTVVMIRHGRYVTIYANLGTISVRTGDKVKAGQSIGTVYVDATDNDRSILHFEIRKIVTVDNITREDPEKWLR